MNGFTHFISIIATIICHVFLRKTLEDDIKGQRYLDYVAIGIIAFNIGASIENVFNILK